MPDVSGGYIMADSGGVTGCGRIHTDALKTVVDSNLDQSSTNPVENAVVTSAIQGKQDQMTEMTDQEIDDLIDSLA